MRYYRVTCLRGHCGRGKAQEITFVFCASSLIEATKEARRMPAVKHHGARAILAGKEITYEEYKIFRQISAYHR